MSHEPPKEGTWEYVDMLVHDCREYLALARGEIKKIGEDCPANREVETSDPAIVAIRLRVLKDECMRMAGQQPLDWVRGK